MDLCKLKRNLERVAKLGYTYYVGTELEFFYLKDAENPEPLDRGGYFDQLSSQLGLGLGLLEILDGQFQFIAIPQRHRLGQAQQAYEALSEGLGAARDAGFVDWTNRFMARVQEIESNATD